MSIKAARYPEIRIVEDKEVIHVSFWQRKFGIGQTMTVHQGAPNTPGYSTFFRCRLTGLHASTIHPMNEHGFIITEQWWDFTYIPEREYLQQKRAVDNNQEQPSLFQQYKVWINLFERMGISKIWNLAAPPAVVCPESSPVDTCDSRHVFGLPKNMSLVLLASNDLTCHHRPLRPPLVLSF